MEKQNEGEIINRVAASALVTFDLEEFYVPGERVSIDIRSVLFQELILKEKEFREYIKAHDWSKYAGKFVALNCSVDAIIPTWAWMLMAVALEPYAKKIVFGDMILLESALFSEALGGVDWERYRGAKVVVKGCSKVDVPVSAYVETTTKLREKAASIMFGEACSTVPLYKKPK